MRMNNRQRKNEEEEKREEEKESKQNKIIENSGSRSAIRFAGSVSVSKHPDADRHQEHPPLCIDDTYDLYSRKQTEM
jgi:hypothetical protein